MTTSIDDVVKLANQMEGTQPPAKPIPVSGATNPARPPVPEAKVETPANGTEAPEANEGAAKKPLFDRSAAMKQLNANKAKAKAAALEATQKIAEEPKPKEVAPAEAKPVETTMTPAEKRLAELEAKVAAYEAERQEHDLKAINTQYVAAIEQMVKDDGSYPLVQKLGAYEEVLVEAYRLVHEELPVRHPGRNWNEEQLTKDEEREVMAYAAERIEQKHADIAARYRDQKDPVPTPARPGVGAKTLGRPGMPGKAPAPTKFVPRYPGDIEPNITDRWRAEGKIK